MACPTGAIYRDDELGVVLVNEGRCIGCWMCTLVCPFGAIVPYFEPKFALKCDFCRERRTQGLEPACVSACPTQALVLTDVEKLTEERRIDHALKMMEAVEPRKYPPGIEIWRSGKFQF
jgi:Fe-S-cluster-containing dehydrogenase component